MKKHDILFQAQEEAFIQALEEEMARETPDPNAIRAIPVILHLMHLLESA